MKRDPTGWGDTYCTCGHKFRLHKLKDRCDHEGCTCTGYMLSEALTMENRPKPPEVVDELDKTQET